MSRIKPTDAVLDIGGWAQPFRRANFVLDAMPYETRGWYGKIGMPDHIGDGEEMFTRETWIQRDICSKEPFPFEDKSIDFVICSHVLEDIRDPLWVCSEIIRVGKRGYIEVPSRMIESIANPFTKVVGMSHHRWLVSIAGNTITFEMKYHAIHREGLHLPAYVEGTLRKEEYVQWLFWEDDFDFAEADIPLGEEEIERRLREFVDANTRDVALIYRLLWRSKPAWNSWRRYLPPQAARLLRHVGAGVKGRMGRKSAVAGEEL